MSFFTPLPARLVGLLLFLLLTAVARSQDCTPADRVSPVFPAGERTGRALLPAGVLQAGTPLEEDYYGEHLALSGRLALTTSDRYDEASEEYTPIVHFLERTPKGWEETFTLPNPDYSFDDPFALSGDYAFITAPDYEDPRDGGRVAGRVLVYRHTGPGTWEQTQLLEGRDSSLGPVDEHFGQYIQASGNFVAIHYGGTTASSNIPRSIVRIFELRDGRWQFHSNFNGFDTPYSKIEYDWGVGAHLAFDGTRLIVDIDWGEQYAGGNYQSGRVYFEYDEETGKWEDRFVFEQGTPLPLPRITTNSPMSWRWRKT